MMQPDFLQALETELRFRGIPFDRGALLAFVPAAWPAAEETADDVDRWANDFLVAQLVQGK